MSEYVYIHISIQTVGNVQIFIAFYDDDDDDDVYLIEKLQHVGYKIYLHTNTDQPELLSSSLNLKHLSFIRKM
jgi:hypothetical protein